MQNFNCLVLFNSRRPSCNHLLFNFIKKHSNAFFLKKVDFCILTQKHWSKRQLLQNTAKRFLMKNAHILAKFRFNFIIFWSEIMSLKRDRLELGFSLYSVV